MPPVPKVILAWPGCTQPWPMSDACWSPAIPAIGGEPANATASPTTPEESTTAGSTDSGTRRASSTGSDQPDASDRSMPVTAALEASVTCSEPLDSVHATQVSTVPKQRSRVRSGSAMSRRNASLVADTLGATRTPWACRPRHMPTVRRSCQPTPGPTGSPVARSHTIVDDRWLAIPTASTGPPSANAACATSSAARAIAAASNSTNPGAGVVGSTSWYCTWSTEASGRTTAARTPLVPTSMTSTPAELTMKTEALGRNPSPERPWARSRSLLRRPRSLAAPAGDPAADRAAQRQPQDGEQDLGDGGTGVARHQRDGGGEDGDH